MVIQGEAQRVTGCSEAHISHTPRLQRQWVPRPWCAPPPAALGPVGAMPVRMGLERPAAGSGRCFRLAPAASCCRHTAVETALAGFLHATQLQSKEMQAMHSQSFGAQTGNAHCAGRPAAGIMRAPPA